MDNHCESILVVNEPERPGATRPTPRVGGASFLTADEVEKRSVFLEVCAEKSGVITEPEAYEKLAASSELLLSQSLKIAQSLESVGVKAFEEGNLFMVGLCSGKVISLPEFRNLVFIPWVARRKRSGMLKHLEFWLLKKPHARMWVVTTGQRCSIAECRDRVKALHRLISKLNAVPEMKSCGVEIVFRSTELGELRRNESGDVTCHVHAHLVVDVKRKLAKEVWTELLRKVRAKVGAHFKDSAEIRNVREVCKYCIKPNDLDVLQPAELKALHVALFGLHIVQVLGSLKEQRSHFQTDELKLVRRSTDDGSRLEVCKDWNRRKRKKRVREVFETPVTEDEREEPRNLVMSRVEPCPISGPVHEPFACVLNYDGDFEKLLEKWELQEARSASLVSYEAGRALLGRPKPHLGTHYYRNCPENEIESNNAATATSGSQDGERSNVEGGQTPGSA